jgi:single-stranded-DNA-specific exonuclease
VITAPRALSSKRWIISPELPPNALAAYGNLHPVVARILHNRGFRDGAAALAFLRGETPLGDPFKMRGIDKAVARIRQAIKRQEPIVVYGDFDADGVTSTVLLTSVLRGLGAVVHHYIPHRVDEGYGLNGAALNKIARRGIKLVITVDCGIRSVQEVEIGKRAGLDMIVTDHHSVGEEVPNALAVINPKQRDCAYPFKMLAGVGVTFKLAEALLKVSKAQDRKEIPISIEDVLDLVAIGTVADLVPLSEPENRTLVIEGLKRLQNPKRLGIKQLLEVAGVQPSEVNAMAIGFAIGPRINAAGRLESATLAYELLSTNDLQVAHEKAEELNRLNIKRQELTREAQAFARTLAGLDRDAEELDVPLVFAASPEFKQGIVGLVAGRLTEETYRPSIVVQQGEHESHGSCRSIPEFNITEALDQCSGLLLRHGGHAQAAGFAIDNENIPAFQKQMMEIARAGLKDKDLRPRLHIDAEVPLRKLDRALYDELCMLEPCGNDHVAPILCSRRVRVVERRAIGKDNAHLKLRVQDIDSHLVMDAVAFRQGGIADILPDYIDIAYKLDLNEWNGSQRLQLVVEDLRESV